MSSPDTNLEKQKRRHRGPLIGIGAALVLSGILAMAIFWEATDSDTVDPDVAPAATPTQ